MKEKEDVIAEQLTTQADKVASVITTPESQNVGIGFAMYKTFATKYRPKQFSELIEQEHVWRTLRGAVKQTRIANAYLFSGPHGVGKTSAARLFAKAINCPKLTFEGEPCNKCRSCAAIDKGVSPDVVEIDGASNRGIDQVRQLKEQVLYAPFSAKYKVYIIDEVHMLTQEAFNALLKILEEPPSYVKFIFATTELRKVLKTVLSRCQRFNFRQVSYNGILSNLENICKKEGLKVQIQALQKLARISNGSLRDAQAMLDQTAGYASKATISLKIVCEIFGLMCEETFLKLLSIIETKDTKLAIEWAKSIVSEGTQPSQLFIDLAGYFRNLLAIKVGFLNLAAPQELINDLKTYADKFSLEAISNMIQQLIWANEALKSSPSGQLVVELFAIRLAESQNILSLKDPISKVDKLSSVDNKITVSKEKISTPKKVEAEPEIHSEEDDNETYDEHEISSDWDTILNVLREEKPSLAAALASPKLVDLPNEEHKVLRIEIKETFSREFVEHADNLELLRKTTQDVLKCGPIKVIVEKPEDNTQFSETLSQAVQMFTDELNAKVVATGRVSK